jgi:branched-chain amino acid aminotransferase
MSDFTGWIYVDERLVPAAEASVLVLDHGLLYGDGLFETLGVHSGRLFQVDQHLVRLRRGAGQLGIEIPWPDAALEEALRETISANQVEKGAARLTVTRGPGLPIPDPSRCGPPTLFITVRASAAAPRAIAATIGGQHPRLFVPAIKSLCYLPFQLARQRARSRGFDDAILTWQGDLVEATSSNLFLVVGSVLLTPPLESGCLDGIMRAAVLEAARELGLRSVETPVPASHATSATEVFLTNSVGGVTPVARLDEIIFAAPGPITAAITDWVSARIALEAR